MNAGQVYIAPPHLMTELATHLRNSGSTVSVAQAATEAIHAWIAANTAQSAAPATAPAPSGSATSRGYQWKSLFLPSGTELRMSTRESTYHARVDGDDIIFGGRRVSPRGMTLAVAGDGRNAWRDLWLKMPGEPYFKPASRCRREQERLAAGLSADPAADLIASQLAAQLATRFKTPAVGPAHEPPTEPPSEPPTAPENKSAHPAGDPAEAVAAAAVAMSGAFQTMLALMERLSPQRVADDERRINRARREEDILADVCALD